MVLVRTLAAVALGSVMTVLAATYTATSVMTKSAQSVQGTQPDSAGTISVSGRLRLPTVVGTVCALREPRGRMMTPIISAQRVTPTARLVPRAARRRMPTAQDVKRRPHTDWTRRYRTTSVQQSARQGLTVTIHLPVRHPPQKTCES
jgi:hypothetical protein